MATLTGVSPVLLVADIERAVEYYRERLGFRCEVFGEPPNFATAARDAAVFLLALCEEPERIVPNWEIVDKVWNAYVRVDDVEAVYAEVQERGAGIDYTIYDAPSGFREFGVQDPDGHDIAFGQPRVESRPVIELAGSRVRLRPPTLADVDALAAAAEADASTMRETGDTERERLVKRIERKPTLEDDGFLGLVIEHERRPVGEIQARAPRHGMPPGGCEIGITLFPESRGLGLGREAVALFTNHLLDAGFDRVQATTATDNAAMQRVLERVGYAFEGTLRSYAPAADGSREDYAMYSFTAREDRPMSARKDGA